MTAPVAVDVRGILAAAADREESRAADLDGVNAVLCRMNVERLQLAMAAVAELIEADREYDRVRQAALTCDRYDAVSSQEWTQMFFAAQERRAAALSRCGGAQ